MSIIQVNYINNKGGKYSNRTVPDYVTTFCYDLFLRLFPSMCLEGEHYTNVPLCFSSKLCMQGCHISSLKLTMVGIFTLWQLAKAPNQGCTVHP